MSLTLFVVTYVSIRTSDTSTSPHGYAFTAPGTLPYYSLEFLTSVNRLSPVELSAHLRLTSELLRTL